jgi:PhnB protein
MKAANPYLNFKGDTEEAFNFYKSVFGGEFQGVLRFRDMGNPMGAPENELDKIAHIALPIGPNNILMGTDVLESWNKPFTVGNNFYITLEPETGEEAEKLFNALSAGGQVEMPLERTEWAEKYGACADKFGVQWMVNYTGAVQFSESAAHSSDRA